MQVNRIRALRGPNLWTHHTAIQTVVECSADECNIAQLPGFEARLRARFPDVPLVVDAGIGSPKDAVQAMELGYDAVLLNSAVSQARDPVAMALAFKLAVESGRLAWEAGIMARQDMAVPSTPVTGRPFVL